MSEEVNESALVLSFTATGVEAAESVKDAAAGVVEGVVGAGVSVETETGSKRFVA